jgi:adenylate kinase
MTRYKTILLFGAPGAGKGTQGKILGIVPGFYHLSCGEVFRSLDMGTKLGRTFMEYSSKGLLVPDDATIQMWHQNMHARTVLAIYKPHVDLLVLDGIPRNVSQAKLLSKHLDVLQIVHLMCPDKEKMMERLRRRAIKENRADDAKEEVIRQRWAVYEEETFPVLDYYPNSLVSEIDAMGSPAEVLEKVLHIVVPVQNAHFLNPAKPDSKTQAIAGSGGGVAKSNGVYPKAKQKAVAGATGKPKPRAR